MISKLKIFDWMRISLYFIQSKANKGFCPICWKNTFFVEYGEWLRDNYKCVLCNSIPRQRAIINALNLFCPNWREKQIHESSPGGASSDYLKRECKNYSESHFFKDVRPGQTKNGIFCQNLEKLTFDDRTFDIFITQDVFEHIFDPEKAFSEIARVLNLNGMHIFTLPLYRNFEKTKRRAIRTDKGIEHIEKEINHGNPIDKKGSLVTIDWGMDICDLIHKYSGLNTTIFLQKDRNIGLDAEFLEVFISRK